MVSHIKEGTRYWVYLRNEQVWYNHITKKITFEEDIDIKETENTIDLTTFPEFTYSDNTSNEDNVKNILYDNKNPLTHYLVGQRVKDLPIEKRILYVLEYSAKTALKNLYIAQIKCIENRLSKKMSHIPPLIKELFARFLFLEREFVQLNKKNWFDDNYDHWISSLRHRKWTIDYEDEVLTLIDINYFPGDDEYGCIFISRDNEHDLIAINENEKIKEYLYQPLKIKRFLPSLEYARTHN